MIDAVRVGRVLGWPVGLYALSADSRRIQWGDGGLGGSIDPGAPSSSVRSLRKASAEAVLAWTRANGFVGVGRGLRSDELRATDEEWVEDIRTVARRIESARRLLDAVRAGESARRLRRRTLALGQAPQDFRAEGLGLDWRVDPPRASLPADVEAVRALAWAIGLGLSGQVSAEARVLATRYSIRATPVLVAVSPAGWAFLDLFEELSSLQINRGRTGRRLLWRDELVACPNCGKRFRRVRRDQKFCSKRCRWAAGKRKERKGMAK